MNELLELFSPNFDAYLQGPLAFVVLIGIGLIVGILTGLFGVGGGFLVNPLLIVLMGIQETLAVGASLSFTIGTGAAGMARHWRMRNVDGKSISFLILGVLPGVMLGKYVHTGLRDALGPFRFAVVFRVLYLLMLLATVWVVHRAPGRSKDRGSPLQRMAVGPRVDLCGGQLEQVSLPGLLLVGASIGLMNGLLGIGGGVLFVPLLLAVVGLSMHMAIGTSLGVVVVSSILGTALYGQSDNVNMLLVMSLLFGSTVGVQLGARICRQLQANRLQRYFIMVVLLAALLITVDLTVKLIRA